MTASTLMCGCGSHRPVSVRVTHQLPSLEAPRPPVAGMHYIGLMPPDMVACMPTDISEDGEVVGTCNDTKGAHGFVYKEGVYHVFELPPESLAESTSRPGNWNRIYGTRSKQEFGGTWFKFTKMTTGPAERLRTWKRRQGVTDAWVNAENADGDSVGVIETGKLDPAKFTGLVDHGFVAHGDQIQAIETPIANAGSEACGIDAAGDVVGFFGDGEKCGHGFFLSKGKFTILDDPNAALDGWSMGTLCHGVNSLGQVTGYYETAGGTYRGFLLTSQLLDS